MNTEIRRLEQIRNIGIATFIGWFPFIGLILLELFIPEQLVQENIFIGFVIVTMYLSFLILANFIISIIIMCANWKTKWAREHKVVWGLLSLFLLTCLGLMIFGATALRHAYAQDDAINNYYNNQMPEYGQYRNYPYPPMPPRPYEDTYNSPYSNNSRKKRRDEYNDRFDDRFGNWY
ncbi:MAG: hypothetical protein K2K73_00475 [Ureaplasma sp.]|nr:hypothetical protein [Ureaplasma sp.]